MKLVNVAGKWWLPVLKSNNNTRKGNVEVVTAGSLKPAFIMLSFLHPAQGSEAAACDPPTPRSPGETEEFLPQSTALSLAVLLHGSAIRKEAHIELALTVSEYQILKGELL